MTSDPNITDAECKDFSGRLEDRYNQGDMANDSHPERVIRVDQVGYTRWESSYVVKRQDGQDHETATRAVLAEINAIVGAPPSPTPPQPGALQQHQHGNGFATSDGVMFRNKPMSGFTLCDVVKTDIGRAEIFLSYLRTRANAVRVFGAWKIPGVREYGPGYDLMAYVRDFVEPTCAFTHERGVYLHWVVQTSNKQFGWDVSFMRDMIRHVEAELVRWPHTKSMRCNEWRDSTWQNIDAKIYDDVAPPVSLIAAMDAPEGSGEWYAGGPYNSIMVHNRREFYESGGGPDGWVRYVGRDVYKAYEETRRAACADEPMKQSVDGSVEHWRKAALFSSMFAAWFTLHGNSDTLQICRLPSAAEDACLAEASRVIDCVQVDAPNWLYARYGPNAPAVQMPVERGGEDDSTIRVYAMVKPDNTEAVAIDLHSNRTLKPINGWSVVYAEPGFARLKR